MVATASDIKTILQTGTYPSIFSTDHIFDYKQVDKRRFYPSIEILPKKDTNRYDRKKDEKSVGYVINIYMKRLGIMSNEISDLESIETEVETLLRAGDLVDNRIILETVDWNRSFNDDKGPNYVLSTITFRVVELGLPTSTFSSDGFLIYDTSESSGDNKPLSDYQYLAVFDTEESSGYQDSEEETAKNPDDGQNVPVHFAGKFGGNFITHFTIGINDVGTTDDKLNHLNGLKTNGEKPEIAFTYNDKDNASTPNGIVNVTFIEVDQIQRMYKHNDLVIFRLVGKVIKPGTLTIS